MAVFDPTASVPTIDPNKDYYSEYVGEGKKYKDNLAAGRAIAEKDIHIDKVQNEAKALREALTEAERELKTRTSLDEFLSKVKDEGTRSKEPNHGSEPATVSEDKINEIITARLTASEKQRVESQNVSVVQSGLAKVFGSNYVPTLEAKAQELGVGKEFLENLAKTSPKAFFNAIGVNPEQSKSVFNAPQGTVNVPLGNSDIKNYAYYQALKKKIPASEYYSAKIQNEMFAQARKLGDEF